MFRVIGGAWCREQVLGVLETNGNQTKVIEERGGRTLNAHFQKLIELTILDLDENLSFYPKIRKQSQ